MTAWDHTSPKESHAKVEREVAVGGSILEAPTHVIRIAHLPQRVLEVLFVLIGLALRSNTCQMSILALFGT